MIDRGEAGSTLENSKKQNVPITTDGIAAFARGNRKEVWVPAGRRSTRSHKRKVLCTLGGERLMPSLIMWIVRREKGAKQAVAPSFLTKLSTGERGEKSRNPGNGGKNMT